MEPGEIAVWRDAVDTVERRAVAAETQNAALTEQVADHKRNAAILNDKLRRTTEGFQAEAGRLRSLLEKYGTHHPSCIMQVYGDKYECDCGYKAALAPATLTATEVNDE